MEISSGSLPAVAGERATMFVALELSKSSWLVALHSPVADKVSLHRFGGGDVAGLLALIARKQTQAEAMLGRRIRVLSCYEAGYDGFWLHRLLCARGIDNRILDAASILVDRRSRRVKTDRLDAAGLLRTLMALDRGESRVCRVVRVPNRGARGCTASQPGTHPAGRRTWSAFEPHQGRIDDARGTRLRADAA
jgi:transposase